MALLKYFSPAVGKDKLLTDLNGLLSGELASLAANAEVKKVLKDGQKGRQSTTRGAYTKLST